jgi:hypothetical protein
VRKLRLHQRFLKKCVPAGKLCQGTTSVVPQTQQKNPALAAEGFGGLIEFSS